jgi:hypothetical protein
LLVTVLFVLGSFLGHQAIGQSYAVIDLTFTEPLSFIDSAPVPDTNFYQFFVPVEDLDSFFVDLRFLKNKVEHGEVRGSLSAFDLHAGSLTCHVSAKAMSFGDRFAVRFSVQRGGFQSEWILNDGTHENSLAHANLRHMMRYLDPEGKIDKRTKGISPLVYNGVGWNGIQKVTHLF